MLMNDILNLSAQKNRSSERQIKDLNAMAAKILAISETIRKKEAKGLAKVVAIIEDTARHEIGTYQPARGPFPAWEVLAQSTVDDKTKNGFSPPDNPLLRTGVMLQSIKSEVDSQKLVGIVGSTDPKMIFHEFGTSKMPMRPVIGPAAFRSKKVIKRILGSAVVSGFYETSYGPSDIHESLGYNYDTAEIEK